MNIRTKINNCIYVCVYIYIYIYISSSDAKASTAPKTATSSALGDRRLRKSRGRRRGYAKSRIATISSVQFREPGARRRIGMNN